MNTSTATQRKSTSDGKGLGQSSNNKFELLLFRLGEEMGSGKRELFGINVFKVREIVVAPQITKIVNAGPHNLGVANVRGQLIPLIDLPGVAGCRPKTQSNIVLVTEFARSTQAFLVDEVEEIVHMEWKHLLAADNSGGGLISGIARVDGDAAESRLAQILDVEQILKNVLPSAHVGEDDTSHETDIKLPPGSVLLFAEDSTVARMVIEEGLRGVHVNFMSTRNGKEAWERLNMFHEEAKMQGKAARDKVALVLTDLEMPEMDGYTLTRNIKQDPRFSGIPVVIYSSLTGSASEGHASSVGADAYVAKFEPHELRDAIRHTLKLRGA